MFLHLAQHLLATFMAVGNVGLQLLPVEGIVEHGIGRVATLIDTTPRGPSPDAEHGGEEIVIRGIGLFFVVETGYHRDTFIVLIAVKHLSTEGNKRGRGRGVILNDDTLVSQRECPTLGIVIGSPCP